MGAHYVTMGGGGFSMSGSGAATALDRYVVELCGADDPLVVFAPTAAMDSPDYAEKFRTAFSALGVRTGTLRLWEGDVAASVAQLADADVVYVGGGSTVNLVALWRAHGVDQVLADRLGDPIVLAGLSAGGNCWYDAYVTDSFGPLTSAEGLGWLPGSFTPHFDGEAERRPALADLLERRALPSGWAADDGAAICWHDGAVIAHVAERPGAQTWRIERGQEPEPQEMTSV